LGLLGLLAWLLHCGLTWVLLLGLLLGLLLSLLSLLAMLA
jgi:hypothetical protein